MHRLQQQKGKTASLTRQTSSVGDLRYANQYQSDAEPTLQIVGVEKQLDERISTQPEQEEIDDPNKDAKLQSQPYMH